MPRIKPRRSPLPPRTPPRGLPTDPISFGRIQAPDEVLDIKLNHDLPSVLKRMGPPTFPKGRFPLVGFLDSVYTFVAESVRAEQRP